jgi:ABC-type bacteriocin/lantibiotic exporter with double-glycine peptidase domain
MYIGNDNELIYTIDMENLTTNDEVEAIVKRYATEADSIYVKLVGMNTYHLILEYPHFVKKEYQILLSNAECQILIEHVQDLLKEAKNVADEENKIKLFKKVLISPFVWFIKRIKNSIEFLTEKFIIVLIFYFLGLFTPQIFQFIVSFLKK